MRRGSAGGIRGAEGAGAAPSHLWAQLQFIEIESLDLSFFFRTSALTCVSDLTMDGYLRHPWTDEQRIGL